MRRTVSSVTSPGAQQPPREHSAPSSQLCTAVSMLARSARWCFTCDAVPARSPLERWPAKSCCSKSASSCAQCSAHSRLRRRRLARLRCCRRASAASARPSCSRSICAWPTAASSNGAAAAPPLPSPPPPPPPVAEVDLWTPRPASMASTAAKARAPRSRYEGTVRAATNSPWRPRTTKPPQPSWPKRGSSDLLSMYPFTTVAGSRNSLPNALAVRRPLAPVSTQSMRKRTRSP
mmetsp:Transcript_39273/g.127090  ORF Transcript_39273/g.127090 Transcript_39273/m.127090 type:complete len:234 (-) Transcript_39273:54-755(-)